MRSQLKKYVNKSIRISRADVSNFGLKNDKRMKVFNKNIFVPTLMFSSLYIGDGTEIDHSWVILDPDIFNRLGNIKIGSVVGFTAKIRYYDKKLSAGSSVIDIGVDSICGKINVIAEGGGMSIYEYLTVLKNEKKILFPDFYMKKVFHQNKEEKINA